MGNSPTCEECTTPLPKTIQLFQFISLESYGNNLYKYFYGEKWIKIGDNEFLCPSCVKKRGQKLTEFERKSVEQKEIQINKEEKKNLDKEKEERVKHVTDEKQKTEDQQNQQIDNKSQNRSDETKQEEYRRQCRRKIHNSIHAEITNKIKIKDKPYDNNHMVSSIVVYKEVPHKLEETILTKLHKLYDNCKEDCATVETMSNTLLNLRRLQWDPNQVMAVISNPFVQDNLNETANVLRLIDIHAIKPDDILSVPTKTKFSLRTSYKKMTVSDFLSKDSSNIQNTISEFIEKMCPKNIDFIVHEISKVFQMEDLNQIKRVIERMDELREKRIPPVPIELLHFRQLIFHRKLFNPHNDRRLGFEHRRFINMIYYISNAVHATQNFWPNHVQIFALLSLFRSHQKGALLEVKTGEGKSCIIAMFAALLCLSELRNSVDIISSSCVLASRDVDCWEQFYKRLNISVTHNITTNDQNARQKCYSKNIVYGTVSSFASDILREEFLLEKSRSDRKFETVIVDEVDSLLLDNGIQFTYLSHSVPGLHFLEPVLLLIWYEVVRYSFIQCTTFHEFAFGEGQPFNDFLSSCFQIPNDEMQIQWVRLLHVFVTHGILREHIYYKILQETSQGKSKLIEKNSVFRQTFDSDTILRCLDIVSYLNSIEFDPFKVDIETNMLVRVNMKVCGEGALKILILDNGYLSFLFENKATLIQLIKQKVLKYLESNDQNNKYEIPQNLMAIVKNRISEWIENAFEAKEMQEGREYLVLEDGVVPIDFKSTGVIEHGTKWGDCLHQFLEIKHSKEISDIGVVTNYLSNQAFFKRYKRIFGLTGTLGTVDEKSYILGEFNLKCIEIPTSKRQKFHEIPGQICENTEEWISKIKACLISMKEQGRPILVICEDINKTKIVSESLHEIVFNSKIVYNRNDVENEEIKRPIKTGDLIIATNIAGRGTDLHIHDDVNNRGGLFVLVTFLPLNERVEKQIFGRTARKGHTGSAQLIIDRSSLSSELDDVEKLSDLKEIRNKKNALKIKDYRLELANTVRKKENLFKTYCRYLKSILILKEDSEHRMYRNSMHEFWGFWLKKHFSTEASLSQLQTKLRLDLGDAFEKIISNDSPNSNIFDIILIANEELENKNYEKARTLFTKAIKHGEKWSAVAYYNRAFCSLRQRNPCLRQAVEDFERARDRFVVFKERTLLCIALIQATQGTSNDAKQPCPGSIMLQMQTRCLILGYLDDNINSNITKIKEMQESKKDIQIESITPFCLALVARHRTESTKKCENFGKWVYKKYQVYKKNLPFHGKD